MYTVHLASMAADHLRGCPADLRAALIQALEGLARDPRPPGCRKLSGALAGSWRIRVRSHRILYETDDGRHVVLVAKIGPRQSIYR